MGGEGGEGGEESMYRHTGWVEESMCMYGGRGRGKKHGGG